MKISNETLAILSNALEFLAPSNVVIREKLSRAAYSDVSRVLEALGGKWDRKSKSHVFGGDRSVASLRDDVERVIETGSVETGPELGWFATPAALAEKIASYLPLSPGETVLEPSAGEGALALAVLRREPTAKLMCVELNEGRAKALRAAGFTAVTQADFLQISQAAADVTVDHVVMNPPFAKRADLEHVEHALGFLRPGGTLVAVMAGGIVFRQDRKSEQFRAMIASLGGDISPLPESSFAKSGTEVKTVLLRVRKPSAAIAAEDARVERDAAEYGVGGPG